MDRVKGVFSGLFKYSDLIKQLVSIDIKLRYRRSFLGYLWSVLNPLLIMLVMTAVFSLFFKYSIENFPVYLLTGNVLFSFMNESTSRSMVSVIDNASLMKKVYLPKYVFVLSRVASTLVNMVFSMVALVVVMLITGAQFTPYLLLTPLVLIQLFFFCLGVSLFLASATVFFRDIQYIWSVVTTAWMYMTPIFYPDTVWPESYAFYLKLFNPMYSYIRQFRDLVMNGCVTESPYILIAGVGYAVIALAIGLFTFYKGQDKFILYV